MLRFADFPILLETWRDLLIDEFDIPTLAGLLDDIAAKRITLHVTRPTRPTPFSVEPGDPGLEPALAIYRFFLSREFSPLSSVTVEAVNQAGATASPYAEDLRQVGFVNDYRGLTLWRR